MLEVINAGNLLYWLVDAYLNVSDSQAEVLCHQNFFKFICFFKYRRNILSQSIVEGDQMLSGMQDFDFAPINHFFQTQITPKFLPKFT